LTPCTNPWNAVYKLASNKIKGSQTMTTLQKPDALLTSDLNETVKFMIDYLIPNVEQTDDKDYYKNIRTLTTEPRTADDRDHTPAEVKNPIDILNHTKRATGRQHYRRNLTESIQTNSYIFLHTIQVPEEMLFPEQVESS